MADTRYTPQKITKAGKQITYIAPVIVATTDYVMKNDGRTFIHVINTNAATCTVIAKTPAQVAGLDVAENSVIVAGTSGSNMIGPFPPSLFNDGNGDMRFNFSAIADVLFAGVSV
jgi:hypothetical protein